MSLLTLTYQAAVINEESEDGCYCLLAQAYPIQCRLQAGRHPRRSQSPASSKDILSICSSTVASAMRTAHIQATALAYGIPVTTASMNGFRHVSIYQRSHSEIVTSPLHLKDCCKVREQIGLLTSIAGHSISGLLEQSPMQETHSKAVLQRTRDADKAEIECDIFRRQLGQEA